ncbi:MAG TPA: DUF222 domain-containing protein [Mycobacteriales bacterium]|nr:DUF222 domain-containing protein [Mycobacteriales bacterium]
MFLMVECPDELFIDGLIPAVMTGAGVRLEAVEDVPAGPWLAAVIDGIDPPSLSEWDLPAYLRVCERMQAWAAARVCDGVAELAARPGGFGADKEVALALREPVGAAQRRIHHARRLLRLLPTTRRLFRAGALSEKQVDAIVEATAGVEDAELAAAVEDKVLTAQGALAKTARELARAARQALMRLDPAGAEDRSRAAREHADVVFIPGEDGTATTALDGPVEEALIVKNAADAYAATCKAAGDTRRIGVLRSEGLARICGDYLRGFRGGLPPRSGGLPIEIGIVVGVDTALGRRELPAEVPGLGIVPRDVIARMIDEERARLKLWVIDEGNGRLVHRAVTGYRPTPEQIAQVRAQYVYSVGPGSQVLAGRTDTDHAVPYPDGPTAIGNLLPNDRTWHNGHTRQQLSVTVDDRGAVKWTSVLGQSRTVTPHDYGLHLAEPDGAEPPAAQPLVDEPPPLQAHG